jgi:RimJ/RimL family protein N-acetyltransferase
VTRWSSPDGPGSGPGRDGLPLPPGNEDLEIGWQLHPDVWGNGYASEATYALATWAFSQDVQEIFAVVRVADLDRADPKGHHPPNLSHD